jgi:hypothetical protein
MPADSPGKNPNLDTPQGKIRGARFVENSEIRVWQFYLDNPGVKLTVVFFTRP